MAYRLVLSVGSPPQGTLVIEDCLIFTMAHIKNFKEGILNLIKLKQTEVQFNQRHLVSLRLEMEPHPAQPAATNIRLTWGHCGNSF